MAVAVRSVSTKASGTTSCSVAAPSGVQPGDLELLFVNTYYGNSVSVEGGWTNIVSSGAPVYTSMGGYDSNQDEAPHLYVYRRSAPADCANAITLAGSDHLVAFRVALTGASKVKPIEKIVNRANTGSISFPYFTNTIVPVSKGLAIAAISYALDSNTTYEVSGGEIGGTGVVPDSAPLFSGGSNAGRGGGLTARAGQIALSGYIIYSEYEKYQLGGVLLPTDTNSICSLIIVNEYTNALAFPSASSVSVAGAKGSLSATEVLRSSSFVALEVECTRPHDRLAQIVMPISFGGNVVDEKAVLAPVDFPSIAKLFSLGVPVAGNNMLVFAAGFHGLAQNKKGVSAVMQLPLQVTASTTVETETPDPDIAGPTIFHSYVESRNGPIPPENYLPGDTYLWYGGTELDWDWPRQTLLLGDIRVIIAFIAPNDGYTGDFSYSSGGYYDSGPMYHTLLGSGSYLLLGTAGRNAIYAKVFIFRVTTANVGSVQAYNDIDYYLRAYALLPKHGWCTSFIYTVRGADYSNPIDAVKIFTSGTTELQNDLVVKNFDISKKNNLLILAGLTYSGDPVTLDPDGNMLSQGGDYNIESVLKSFSASVMGISYAFRAREAGLFHKGLPVDAPVLFARNANARVQCGIAVSVNGIVPKVGHTEAHLALSSSLVMASQKTTGRDAPALFATSWISATTEKTFEPIYVARLTEASSMAVLAEKACSSNFQLGPHILLEASPMKWVSDNADILIRTAIVFDLKSIRDEEVVLPCHFHSDLQVFAHRDIPVDLATATRWKVVAAKGSSQGVHLAAASSFVSSSKILHLTTRPCYTAVKQDPALEIKPSK